MFSSIFSMYTMTLSTTVNNKTIPESVKEEVMTALNYYPELVDTPIVFKFKPAMKKSVMKAQPVFSSLFLSKKKRRYIIFMSKDFRIDGLHLRLEAIPREVLIGWIGHELGHILDYKNRSSWNLINFGVRYVFFDDFIREAEIAADTNAVQHGLIKNILATKEFILSHADLSERYKARIRKLYMSPDAILNIVRESDKVQ